MHALSQLERTSWLRRAGTCALLAMIFAPPMARAQLASVVVQPGPEALMSTGSARNASPSRSTGRADRGRLSSPALLIGSEHVAVREVPENGRITRYGTYELVALIQRSARRVAELHPGAQLSVGDLSGPRGGRLSPHRSHRSGRDADVGFYLLDEEGHPIVAPHFVNIRRHGTGRLNGHLVRFDVERNWDLLVALTDDPDARVQYILVTSYLRRMLLAEGRRRGASAEEMERVELVTRMHAGSASHRSHFHVRIYCPADDRPQCVDEPPFHPWYDGTPPVPAEPAPIAVPRRGA